MGKILSSVLNSISENNNEYRDYLKNLNNYIDEKSTNLIGELVTLSNYVMDFSATVSGSKEALSNPLYRIVESYVIKDLRSVESVNEQFVDKINDKIENSDLSTPESRNNFVENLNQLLNEKYIEIVNIKRIEFFDSNNTNENVEECINNYIIDLMNNYKFDNSELEKVIGKYKNDIYSEIKLMFDKINKLYLDNFSNGIKENLKNEIDLVGNSYEKSSEENITKQENNFVMPSISKLPVITEEKVLPEIPVVPEVNEIPVIPDIPEERDFTLVKEPEIHISITDDNQYNSNIEETKNEEDKKEVVSKKTYDVEEILKIAKSPVVSLPNEESNFGNKTDSLNRIKPIVSQKEDNNLDFDEEEIVEELIKRLTNRLNKIRERKEIYKDNLEAVERDETFLNDLIDSSNKKTEELNLYEDELNKKQVEIENKKVQLQKKINDVMPFANAILNDKES